MDNLQEIIRTMGEDDRKEFRIFINRNKKKKNRKDLELFRIFESDKEVQKADILNKLYADGNRNAYHSLRKRLAKHLNEFIVIKRLEEDTTAASSVMGLLSLSRYMFDKNSYRLGWKYLRNAEEEAKKNEQFDLLNSVFNMQVEFAETQHANDLKEIIAKRKENKPLAEEDERANIASSLIKLKLQESRVKGIDLDFDKVVEQILKEYKLSEAVTKRPKLLHALMSISRSAILAKKDFHSFAPYIIKQYHSAVFTKKDQYYKLSLLYMIAHTMYRVRKFKEIFKYLELMKEALGQPGTGWYWNFYPRYILLLAAAYAYTDENKKAINILEDILEDESQIGYPAQLNIKLNLAVYYFHQNDYDKTNEVLFSIYHTDNWCEKLMGKEWVLRKNMIELINQYELENYDVASNWIRAVDRNYKDLLSQHRYRNAKGFLGILRLMIAKP
ncbi:MAG: hypothetical protein IH946_07485, partial [Bacteroidetes bacterium]|nr:hypothetical protein [Bacteroidota bacterium]